MLRNPKFAGQGEQPQAPKDSGRQIIALPRGDSVEMRLSLASYLGRPFVSFRIWERGRDGQFWPVKGKGCSVRVGEIANVIAALQEIEALLQRGQAGEGDQADDQ